MLNTSKIHRINKNNPTNYIKNTRKGTDVYKKFMQYTLYTIYLYHNDDNGDDKFSSLLFL